MEGGLLEVNEKYVIMPPGIICTVKGKIIYNLIKLILDI